MRGAQAYVDTTLAAHATQNLQQAQACDYLAIKEPKITSIVPPAFDYLGAPLSPDDAHDETEESLLAQFEAMVKKEIRDFMAFTRSLQLKWTVDPLSFWRKENTRFPLLGALSRRRLCIQGAAVPSERLFKKARDTCTKIRASMSPEYASDLIFCAENLPRMRDAQREKLKEEAVDKVELSLSSSSTKQASSSSTKQVCASSSSTAPSSSS